MGQNQSSDEKPNDTSTETIIDVSAQLSSHLAHEAKDQVNELAHLPLMLLRFLRNPIRFIKTTPDLKTVSWVALAIGSGVFGAILNGLLYQSIVRFAIALAILPVGSFLSVFATNSILKILFRTMHGLKYRYRSGASIFAFASYFWWAPIAAVEKFPPIALLGFIVAMAIAAAGYVTKLQLPPRLVLFWFSAIALAHMALLLVGRQLGA